MKPAIAAAAWALLAGTAHAAPSAPAPILEYAFTATVQVAAPVEMGQADGGRKRFIAITGGKVEGPMLAGEVLNGGGDWQVIEAGGLTRVEARYFLKAADGTVIEVENPGVRVAEPAVIERLARGEDVDPSAYYFRTTPRFVVTAGRYDWMRRNAFVARGIRKPDRVIVDYYIVR
ncbi:MAG: DUF3237 domain-containing protein [Sphingomonadales bacterium]|nr:DUF3237 domain-containing protein [Sphingomonadales bacterium]